MRQIATLGTITNPARRPTQPGRNLIYVEEVPAVTIAAAVRLRAREAAQTVGYP